MTAYTYAPGVHLMIRQHANRGQHALLYRATPPRAPLVFLWRAARHDRALPPPPTAMHRHPSFSSRECAFTTAYTHATVRRGSSHWYAPRRLAHATGDRRPYKGRAGLGPIGRLPRRPPPPLKRVAVSVCREEPGAC